MKTTETIAVSIIILSFIIGIFLYPLVPERMASHWNIEGEVDDYMPKALGLFLFPAISLVLFFLLFSKEAS